MVTADIKKTTHLIATHCKDLGYMELILAVCDGDIIFGDTSYPPVKQYLQQLEDELPRYYLLIFKNDNDDMCHLGCSDEKAVDQFLVQGLNRITDKMYRLN